MQKKHRIVVISEPNQSIDFSDIRIGPKGVRQKSSRYSNKSPKLRKNFRVSSFHIEDSPQLKYQPSFINEIGHLASMLRHDSQHNGDSTSFQKDSLPYLLPLLTKRAEQKKKSGALRGDTLPIINYSNVVDGQNRFCIQSPLFKQGEIKLFSRKQTPTQKHKFIEFKRLLDEEIHKIPQGRLKKLLS